jgi:hypothetical protein
MAEKFPPTNPIESKRGALIKATAFFDAGEHITLMRKKSPESLVTQSDGSIPLNTIDGDEIFTSTLTKLNLTLEEKMKYFSYILEEIKKVLSKKPE